MSTGVPMPIVNKLILTNALRIMVNNLFKESFYGKMEKKK